MTVQCDTIWSDNQRATHVCDLDAGHDGHCRCHCGLEQPF